MTLERPGGPTVRKARETGPKVIEIHHAIAVGDLAERLGANPIEVIKNLMRMGIMASVNQAISAETASPIAQFYGYQVKQMTATPETSLGERMGDVASVDGVVQDARPPVVTILGHVDHGKTSILDMIRKSHVADSEAGGITQHIGAYQVQEGGHQITFLDTPGHEAFTTLRARGAHVTDIAVLVVAADDGVMPQTIEAINHAKAARVPMIIAINKMDLPGADPERVKRQLSEQEILVEDWGGDVISVPVSAKTGAGLPALLESILLVSELAEFKADPKLPARGTVIEARLDPNRGPVATVLIQSGTLRAGSTIVAGTTWGRVRALTNYRGERIQEAGPSMPAEILGLAEVPQSGEIIEEVETEREARALVGDRSEAANGMDRHQSATLEQLAGQIGAGDTRDLNLVIKADVHGSLEALRGALVRLSNDRARVAILHGGVGSITEGDVLLASASGAMILGFNTRVETATRRLADTRRVEIRNYTIIYQLLDDIENALKGISAPLLHEVQEGRAEVRQVFEMRRLKIAGCVVVDGRIRKASLARILRRGAVIYEGPISSLRHFRDEVREATAGQECGIAMEGFGEFEAGDLIATFRREERQG
ncbi:MAG: translation initiation factor IF-2 [Chloroflexi bacterium]|nr:translation initiation factor IF-2 [Chloroflexota bacterium]